MVSRMSSKEFTTRISRRHRGGEEESRVEVDTWLEQNREAIEGWNRWVEHNGLPLAQYRQF